MGNLFFLQFLLGTTEGVLTHWRVTSSSYSVLAGGNIQQHSGGGRQGDTVGTGCKHGDTVAIDLGTLQLLVLHMWLLKLLVAFL